MPRHTQLSFDKFNTHSEVPLSAMFGYATQMRSMTQGRASYAMEFSHYAEVPTNVANEIINGKTGGKA